MKFPYGKKNNDTLLTYKETCGAVLFMLIHCAGALHLIEICLHSVNKIFYFNLKSSLYLVLYRIRPIVTEETFIPAL
jgi:hypothetical protein